MMTNGPAATIGEILEVNLERPRDRLALAEDPEFVHLRQQVLHFLYARHDSDTSEEPAEAPASTVPHLTPVETTADTEAA